jgi:hypothetical protein
MKHAINYANIVLSFTEAELAEVRRDEYFDDVLAWLVGLRRNAIVDAACRRLIGRVH